ncbi:MAG: PP2C family protein-serine/threonine phosphatase [Chloroflexota bacterium]
MSNFFARLFGSPRKEAAQEAPLSKEIPTIPLEQAPAPVTIKTEAAVPAAPAPAAAPRLETRQFEAGCAQSVGRSREHNEDSVLLINTLLSNNGGHIPLGLFIVADGMGGHKHGEVASGLAVRSIANQVMRKIFLSLVTTRPTPPDEPIQEILEGAVIDAHRVIMKEAPGSGTTLTALLLVDEHMSIAHVGDSRAYLFPDDGAPQVLTRDHSLVMRMQELGQITAEEAAIHPQRNVLYRALGQGEPFSPDITSSPLPDGGHLLLCSDGLWGVVPEDQLVELLRSAPDLNSACQMMVDAANEAGGPDNISALLVRLPDVRQA